ncbi:MAG TPA: M23 family metallopeptidase [Candidatus Binatus sp.]|uniref:M23 family metallopeptidase n=1 Tax=Candidatus Binatus sp. TaxID=2811406 RepID=UPI002B499A21|nr:M23 family metallopeptidase [Candidatus Binatus sp.]HKN12208.1 M23 family metallopeptidase [Candidatus Binatus sp.]
MGYPRALVGLVVALIATTTALFLFFQANPQPFSSPLDTLSSQLDAGKDGPDVVEQPESAEPAPPSITISTMLDRTAPIESYLREAGMEPGDAHQWASYIQRITANRYFQSGHPLTLYKDPETGEMRGLKYDLDENSTVIGASLGAGVLKAAIRPIEYYIRPIKMTFAVKDNFQRAAAENGIPKPIVESLQDAFSDRHDLNRLAPGSAVKLIYQEKISRDGSYTLVGDVQAAQIRFGSRTLTAISFSDEHGRPHLYDEQGHALGPQSLKFPLNFQYISSGFTFHRYHPILHEYRPHVGVDLVAKYGEPVKAVADGSVISAGWQGELGNCIRIQHQHQMVSIYGHLSKISPEVKPGGYVHIGQVIGNVGSTGLSTGPHLHFAMEKDGAWVNPLTEKLGENHAVSPRMKAIFDEIKDQYQSALAELPDLGSHFIAAGERKPAISKFGDMYHVTLDRSLGRIRHVRGQRISSSRYSSDGAL